MNLSYNYPDSEKIILKDINCEFLNNSLLVFLVNLDQENHLIDILIGLINQVVVQF